MAEITRKSVLVKCLGIIRSELEICSERYDGLLPKKGMEQAWNECREEIEILKELIRACDSEPVRAALANWQMEVMAHGPEALKLDGGKHERQQVMLVYDPRIAEEYSEEQKRKMQDAK